eukprot:INCI4040.2.p1 GENE.INCI4040.2~~INCI4040.2.p1  ORF type:complete len:660 (+),score=96.06 INCI4040.2:2773-4752(+)
MRRRIRRQRKLKMMQQRRAGRNRNANASSFVWLKTAMDGALGMVGGLACVATFVVMRALFTVLPGLLSTTSWAVVFGTCVVAVGIASCFWDWAAAVLAAGVAGMFFFVLWKVAAAVVVTVFSMVWEWGVFSLLGWAFVTPIAVGFLVGVFEVIVTDLSGACTGFVFLGLIWYFLSDWVFSVFPQNWFDVAANATEPTNSTESLAEETVGCAEDASTVAQPAASWITFSFTGVIATMVIAVTIVATCAFVVGLFRIQRHRHSRQRSLPSGQVTNAAQVKAQAEAKQKAKQKARKQKEDRYVDALVARHGAPPPDLCCPISLRLMVDPVRTPFGHVFERRSIEMWLRESPSPTSCPLTRKPLCTNDLRSAPDVKAAVAAWVTQSIADSAGDVNGCSESSADGAACSSASCSDELTHVFGFHSDDDSEGIGQDDDAMSTPGFPDNNGPSEALGERPIDMAAVEKFCDGGCGWNLGTQNPLTTCSRCQQLRRQTQPWRLGGRKKKRPKKKAPLQPLVWTRPASAGSRSIGSSYSTSVANPSNHLESADTGPLDVTNGTGINTNETRHTKSAELIEQAARARRLAQRQIRRTTRLPAPGSRNSSSSNSTASTKNRNRSAVASSRPAKRDKKKERARAKHKALKAAQRNALLLARQKNGRRATRF